jgi:hypothetical protein
MKTHATRFFIILGLATGLMLPACVSAQTEAIAQVEKKAQELAPKGWQVSKTPSGAPDLQGYYTNVSITPLQRPEAFGNRPLYTPEEAKTWTADPKHHRKPTGYNDVFEDAGEDVAVTMQTSLVVDPPDGRFPAYTPAVQKQIVAARQEVKEKCSDPARVCPPGMDERTPQLADAPTDLSLMTRCIKWGTVGPPMLPSIYDSNYHIVQAANYVVIEVEGGRSVRMIPLDGRPHVPQDVRLWDGDPRGHWEGNTLVVDTTNFSDGNSDSLHTDANLHVIERFTRVAPNVLLYEFTVEDPTVFTQPWTGIVPMRSIKGPIFEYACNEGNYGLADILHGARVEERRKADSGAVTAKPASDAGKQ